MRAVAGIRCGVSNVMDFRPSRSCAYEGWTVVELKKRAKQLGITGYSGLSKEKLVALIRSY